ncbi:hypothetical protein I6U33_00155 [Pseudomonas carnis]|uniref:DUF3742 domain-containing protein n=1 Tax=Pseudomonas paracarnis TaxID=2750625 RepID=A0ABU6BMM3_9PSED|nr:MULTISPECIES: hypothetical protein [Pseudomonas]MBW9235737.1 hypothetical protein [Pseudomonas carnis]MEB3781060.1 hypothetical protein [Pseudomonas paracarnis]
MTAQTSQGVASRLGYGLGQVVRLVWCSENRTLRWVKRLALIAVTVYSWVWLAHAFMAILTVGLMFLALAVGGGSRSSLVSKSSYEPFNSASDNDPYSLENQNNPLFHANYDDNFLN